MVVGIALRAIAYMVCLLLDFVGIVFGNGQRQCQSTSRNIARVVHWGSRMSEERHEPRERPRENVQNVLHQREPQEAELVGIVDTPTRQQILEPAVGIPVQVPRPGITIIDARELFKGPAVEAQGVVEEQRATESQRAPKVQQHPLGSGWVRSMPVHRYYGVARGRRVGI
jgi:hypothetical protein